MSDKQKKIISILSLTIFIVLCILIGYYVGGPMIRFAEDPQAFRDLVNDHGIWSRLVFVGMVVLQVIIAFIPGEPVELLAGYAFGFWEGTLLCLAGFLIGSILIFLLVRKFGVKLVEVFFSQKKIKQMAFLKNEKKIRVISFLLMLIPGTPKDFLSYFAGLTPLSLKTWILIVALARFPSLVSSTATGAAAGEKNYILSAVIMGVTVILTVIGIVYYRKMCRQRSEQTQ